MLNVGRIAEVGGGTTIYNRHSVTHVHVQYNYVYQLATIPHTPSSITSIIQILASKTNWSRKLI